MGLIGRYRGYRLFESDGHGKTVKGMKKTSSIQVREHLTFGDYLLKKSFPFTVGDNSSRDLAISRAVNFIDEISK